MYDHHCPAQLYCDKLFTVVVVYITTTRINKTRNDTDLPKAGH
jgi:hypothetical protein